MDPGDVVVIAFPGVTGIKRRPAVVISSTLYHTTRPDLIVGLITSRGVMVGPTAPPFAIGHLSAADWQAVHACVKAALASLTD